MHCDRVSALPLKKSEAARITPGGLVIFLNHTILSLS